MARYIPFHEFYKNLVEKPGAATHSDKFDRCVADVKAKGSGANAYAVCTAQLGGEAFKSWMAELSKDTKFDKELDEFMHTLGIAGAGPVPESLLARQDLEGSEKVRKSITFGSGADDEVYSLYHSGMSVPQIARRMNLILEDVYEFIEENKSRKNKAVKKGDASSRASILADQGYTVSEIRSQLKSMDYDEGEISDALAYIAPFASKAFESEIASEAEDEKHYHEMAETLEDMADDEAEHKRKLEDMGKASSLEQIVSSMKAKGNLRMVILNTLAKQGFTESEIRIAIDNVFGKGAVEETGKVLAEALKDAPNAETRMERKSLVETIKDAQIKRQKATIQARTKEASGKSFRETWKGLSGG